MAGLGRTLAVVWRMEAEGADGRGSCHLGWRGQCPAGTGAGAGVMGKDLRVPQGEMVSEMITQLPCTGHVTDHALIMWLIMH